MKPTLSPIPTPEGTPFQKMDHLFRSVITVSKEEIDRREDEWKRAQTRKKKAAKKTTS